MRLLQNVRVVEVGGFITGPLAAMILAEYGADVIKLERPDGGDPFRSHTRGGYSPAFQAHNRNKRSITADYAKPEGLKVLHALVRTADVFVNNMKIYSQDVGSGPYQITNIPALTGASTARIVLQDSAGRMVETSVCVSRVSRAFRTDRTKRANIDPTAPGIG